jgi:hypothetical protein
MRAQLRLFVALAIIAGTALLLGGLGAPLWTYVIIGVGTPAVMYWLVDRPLDDGRD